MSLYLLHKKSYHSKFSNLCMWNLRLYFEHESQKSPNDQCCKPAFSGYKVFSMVWYGMVSYRIVSYRIVSYRPYCIGIVWYTLVWLGLREITNQTISEQFICTDSHHVHTPYQALQIMASIRIQKKRLFSFTSVLQTMFLKELLLLVIFSLDFLYADNFFNQNVNPLVEK